MFTQVSCRDAISGRLTALWRTARWETMDASPEPDALKLCGVPGARAIAEERNSCPAAEYKAGVTPSASRPHSESRPRDIRASQRQWAPHPIGGGEQRQH